MNSRVLDEFTFLKFLKQTAVTVSLTFGAVLMPPLTLFFFTRVKVIAYIYFMILTNKFMTLLPVVKDELCDYF